MSKTKSLYIFDLRIDGMENIVEWGVGETEQKAFNNVLVRLAEINDWEPVEAQDFIEIMASWEADEVDGYKIEVKKI